LTHYANRVLSGLLLAILAPVASPVLVAKRVDTPSNQRTILYTTQHNQIDVIAYDGSTLEEIGRVPIALGCMGLTLSPNQAFLYVGCSNQGLYEIDTATLTVTREFPTVPFPDVLVMLPDQSKLYALGRYGNRITVINLPSGSVNTVVVPNATSNYGIALDPTASRVYISDMGRIHVLDTTTDQKIQEFPSVTFGDIAVTPDGLHVATADGNGGGLFVVELASGASTYTAGSAQHGAGLVITGDSSRAYVTHSNTGGRVSVFDLTSRTLVGHMVGLSGIYPLSVRLSNDDSCVYVRSNNRLEIARTSNNTVVGTIMSAFGVGTVVTNGVASRLCVTDSDSDGVDDGADNCSASPNADQANTDGDAQGDVCDPDDDNDGHPDGADNCPLASNPSQTDFDTDSAGDACDPRNAPKLTSLNVSATSILENGSSTLTVSFADPDAGQAHTVSVNWGDGTLSSLVVAAGTFGFSMPHQFPDDQPSASASDSYTVSVLITDTDGDSVGGGGSLIVHNVAPTINTTTGPDGPIALGASATVGITFQDQGPADTHTCSFAWDDGTSTSGVLAASGSCSTTRTYEAAGVYSVGVTVTDDDTGATSTTLEYVVVYDPSGGFVTGGGWFSSAPGAYTANPALEGKASFGFVSKYQKGQSRPAGQTEFQLHFTGFRFNSVSYDWLVVAGRRAQYKGVGTLNGAGDYGFLLTAQDGLSGGDDSFRIKIWDRVSGSVVYDNVIAAPDDMDAASPQLLGGGSIVIHAK
jgi:hypothetical protein